MSSKDRRKEDIKLQKKVSEITHKMINDMEEGVSIHIYWQAIAQFLVITHVADHVRGRSPEESMKIFDEYLEHLKQFRDISVLGVSKYD